MDQDMQQYRIGAAKVTVINVGDSRADLAEWFASPPGDWPPHYAHLYSAPTAVPIQCALIELPTTTLLIDAPFYDIGPGSPYYIPDYEPPAGLFERLAELGVATGDIRHLVITHAHWDHYNGAVVAQNGFVTPAFPNARCYIGRGDWENAKLQESLLDETSMNALTLGVLYKTGLVELVAQPLPIAEGVTVLPAPGESPGHQVVRIESEGEVLYAVGDLYHHPIEVEMSEWMTPWADRTSNLASRRIVADVAQRENAWLFASHIPGLGKLTPLNNGVGWVGV